MRSNMSHIEEEENQEVFLDDISYSQVVTKKVTDDPFKKVK